MYPKCIQNVSKMYPKCIQFDSENQENQKKKNKTNKTPDFNDFELRMIEKKLKIKQLKII